MGALTVGAVLRPHPGRGLGRCRCSRALWPLLYAWPIALAFVFPNGRLLTRRWRWVAIAGAAASSASCRRAARPRAVRSARPGGAEPAGRRTTSRTGSSGSGCRSGSASSARSVAGAIAIRLRLRRSTGVERLQTLWVAWAACADSRSACSPASRARGSASPSRTSSSVPILLGMPIAVAVAVGIAVARYRLYAIERLVNRTRRLRARSRCCSRRRTSASRWRAGVAVGRGSDWVTAAGDARRRALVPPAAVAGPGRRRPPLRPRALERLRRCRRSRTRCARACGRPRRSAACSREALRDPLAELRVLAARERDVRDRVG